MEAVSIMPRQGNWTYDDFVKLPDDGLRYELIDGILLVSPSPVHRHQRAVARLLRILAEVTPDDLEVLPAPLDVVLASDTVIEPDLLVARISDFSERNLPGAPLLAIEVLSPSTRLVDLNLKKARLELAGCPSYWVFDPDPDAPRLLAWDLRSGAYVEVADVSGDESWTAARPFPVMITPTDLVRPSR